MTSVLAEIDAACAAFAREHNIPGLVAGIVQESRLVHVAARGLADIEADRLVTPSTAFRIASMTKSTTALGILLLARPGQARARCAARAVRAAIRRGGAGDPGQPAGQPAPPAQPHRGFS
jgi:hypothetical protein